MTETIDAARLTLMLNDLRLPAIKQDWPGFTRRADRESWPAARLLASLAEHEIAERDRRRLARHLAEAQLLPGKTLDSFDFNVVPMVSKAHVLAICAGDSWIDKGANLILIGGPGGGKTHLASAIGLALVENGWRVLFTRTSDLVQRLQVARRELAPEEHTVLSRPGAGGARGRRNEGEPGRTVHIPLGPGDPRQARIGRRRLGGVRALRRPWFSAHALGGHRMAAACRSGRGQDEVAQHAVAPVS